MPRLAGLQSARAVALLSIGAHDKHRADALFGVASKHAAGAKHLVVGVCMNGHEREAVAGARRSRHR